MKIQKFLVGFGVFAAFVLLAVGATVYADSAGTKTTSTVAQRISTPTIGPTVTACPDKPAAPVLVSPANHAAFKSLNATLDWKNVNCAASYYVIVRKGSIFGATVDQGGVYPSLFTTKNLPGATTYVWHVSACNWHGCTGSPWWTFTLKP